MIIKKYKNRGCILELMRTHNAMACGVDSSGDRDGEEMGHGSDRQEKAKAKESMGQVMSDGTADLNRRQVVGREGKHTKMDLLATGPIASWSKSSDIRSQKKIFKWSLT